MMNLDNMQWFPQNLPRSAQWLLSIDDGLVPVFWYRGEDVNLIAASIRLGVWTGIHPTKNPQFVPVQSGTVVGSGGGFPSYLLKQQKNRSITLN